MDLEKAITSSIYERSLDKIHDYFEQSLFGASHHLGSGTVSILLRSLEKYEDYGDKVFNVKCVLTCLKKFLEFESHSSLWEQLAENIGKICEASFCISVKLKDTELIEHNISVLEQIIEVNQNLTNHICGYLLDPCLTAFFVRQIFCDFDLLLRLANFTSLLCKKTSRMKRNEIVPTVIHKLTALPNLVISCGDYEVQAAIMEVIARCNSSIVPSLSSLESNEILNLFSSSEKFDEEFIKYSFVNFEPDCRLFLNTLNESLRDKRKVYSIPCICVVHNDISLEKPKDPKYKFFWVDFNLGRKQISFYHEPLESNWIIKCVPFDEIVQVIAKDTVCCAKKSNQNVKSVKVEFIINCESYTFLKFESLKMYIRKVQFNLLHRVLVDIFPYVYESEVDCNIKSDTDLPQNQPNKLTCFTPYKALSGPRKFHKILLPHKSAEKSEKFFFPPTDLDMQCNTSDITQATGKLCENISDTMCENNYSNILEGISSICKSTLKLDDGTTQNTSRLEENKCKIKQNKVRQKDFSIEFNNNTTFQKVNETNSVGRTSSESAINDHSKKPDGNNCRNDKDSTVKRKRLFSNESNVINEKSMVLSSLDENHYIHNSPPKKPSAKGKSCFIFNAKNVSCRKVAKKKKSHRLFKDVLNSDEAKDSAIANQFPSSIFSNKVQHKSVFGDKVSLSLFEDNVQAHDTIPECSKLSPHLFQYTFQDHSSRIIEKNEVKSKITKFAFPELSSCSSDSDYDSISWKGNRFIKENKRVLRSKSKLDNVRDSIEYKKSKNTEVIADKTRLSIVESDQTPSPPKKSKISEHYLKEKKSSTITPTESPHADDIHISKTNKNKFLLKKNLKESSSFVNIIPLSRKVDPMRDEIHCSNVEVNAVQPEASDFLPKEITLFERECQIRDPADLSHCVDLKGIASSNDKPYLGSKSNLESIILQKEKPLHMWNVVNEISVEIHDESIIEDKILMQTSFKVQDILEFSQKSVMNLKNNIETRLIQSHKERQQNLIKYNAELQTSRNHVLQSCKKLQSNYRNMVKYKPILEETLNLQQDLIFKIENEMEVLEKAKGVLFTKDYEDRCSETFSITKLFKGVGTYIRRLLFTSYHQSALTSQNQNQTEKK